MDTFPPDLQRRALASFATALGSPSTAMRRDACGDPRITGSTGFIYAVPGGWQVVVETENARAWNVAKRKLGFAQLLRDGDSEGAVLLDRLPSQEEATTIRAVIGVRKRPEISAERRVSLVHDLDLDELTDLAMLTSIPRGQANVVPVS